MVAHVLSPFDRATLLFWRITNVVGWSALGVYLAFGFHQMLLASAPETAGYQRNEAVWGSMSLRSLIELAATRLVVLGLTSGVIAWFVARKVVFRPLLVASLAGIAYVALALPLLEHNVGWAGYLFGVDTSQDGLPLFVPNGFVRSIVHDIPIALTIPLSWWLARRSLRKTHLPT